MHVYGDSLAHVFIHKVLRVLLYIRQLHAVIGFFENSVTVTLLNVTLLHVNSYSPNRFHPKV